MLTYSSEAAFFLTLCELVLSGLSLVALASIRFWERAPSRARGGLLLAFTLLAAGFAAQAAYGHLALLPTGGLDARFAWLLTAADAIRLGASAAIVCALRNESGRAARVPLVLLLAGATAAAALLWLPPELGSNGRTIDPLTPLRLADVIVLAAGAMLAAGSGIARAGAVLLLCIGRASALLTAVRPALGEWCWGAGHIFVLSGLLLFASTLERQSERRVLQYVLRFNLIFLMLAASLIMVLTEIARRQFVDFSALQIRDVVEFARGHLIDRTRRGAPPEATLADPALIEQMVRELGRYPDLRRVELELRGDAMSLAINDAGEIAQEFWAGERSDPTRVAPADFTQALLVREPVLSRGETIGRVSLYHSVVPINLRVGRQMQVAFTVFTLFVTVGSVVTGILVHLADRTIARQNRELAAAQRRLLHMERLASVGAVADGVAHEINNPAGVLVARSDYLLAVTNGKPYAGEIQEDLDTIRRQSQRIAKTVSDLLSSTRRARSRREAVDISKVVVSAIKLVRPVVPDREVTFTFHPLSTDLFVWGDQDRLEQVFINLLSNAAQAIPERGDVTVTASRQPSGTWVDVVIADTGVGIAPEHLDRVFERFFTTKQSGTGSGLGLSIVHGIVSDHGGQISIASTPGKGSEFRVTLPACAPDSRSPSPPSQHPSAVAVGAVATGTRTHHAGEPADD